MPHLALHPGTKKASFVAQHILLTLPFIHSLFLLPLFAFWLDYEVASPAPCGKSFAIPRGPTHFPGISTLHAAFITSSCRPNRRNPGLLSADWTRAPPALQQPQSSFVSDSPDNSYHLLATLRPATFPHESSNILITPKLDPIISAASPSLHVSN
jgi:hypothetical protein